MKNIYYSALINTLAITFAALKSFLINANSPKYSPDLYCFTT